MKKTPENIDEYLATVPETHRATLKKLCEQIKKLYPHTTEHISYSAPLFKLDGHPLAGLAAHKQHSSLFVWSDTALGKLGDTLKEYDTTVSTIRFAPNQLLPERIVKAVLDARAQEIKERWGSKKS